MKVLGVVTALIVLCALKGPRASRGEQQGPRELLSVTLKVPFSTVFMTPGPNCGHTNRTEMADDDGSKITAIQHVCVKYVDIHTKARKAQENNSPSTGTNLHINTIFFV